MGKHIQIEEKNVDIVEKYIQIGKNNIVKKNMENNIQIVEKE